MSRVEIARDRWGMPAVRAQTAADLWFGQGFCHGQDRLWQIDVQRRICSGRVSEIAGRAGLPVDRLMRTLGLRRLALREEAELDADLRPLLDAYCAGLNEAARRASALPAEFQLLRLDFEPWRPADMLAGGKLLSFGLSTNWERELLRADLVRELGEERAAKIDPTYPKGNPIVLRPGEGFDGDGLRLAEQIGRVRDQIGLATAASGSNNWAVSASRSATGGALLAGDPHLPSGMPGIWYEVSLELDGRTCRGASIPGLPGISLGQNDDVAFAFTNVMADVEDLFVERIEDESYEFEGEQRPLEIIEELIAVRGQDQAERHEVRLTHHGPIVNQPLGADDEQPLALRWAALDEPGISHAHVGRSGAAQRRRSWCELLRTVTMPVSNLVWADRHGSIGYKMMGRIPKRKGDCPDLPKPGWTGEFEWDGWIPYDELPELVDPERGSSSPPTTGSSTAPTHITSPATGWTATGRRGSSSCSRRPTSTTSTASADSGRPLFDPRRRGGAPTGATGADQPARDPAHRAPEELGPAAGPGPWRATIYQAFMLRLAREFTRAAIGDRDLAER